MASTNNAVAVSATLANSVLTIPAIGTTASFQCAFTDGDTASDSYINCATVTGTALNADILGNGYLLVSNPSANVYNVTLKISSTAIGDLLPGGVALIPINSGTIVTGVSATAAQNVGVTLLEIHANV